LNQHLFNLALLFYPSAYLLPFCKGFSLHVPHVKIVHSFEDFSLVFTFVFLLKKCVEEGGFHVMNPPKKELISGLLLLGV